MKELANSALLTFMAGALLLGGFWASSKELAAYQVDTSSPRALYDWVLTSDDHQLSIDSQREALVTCSSLLFSIYPRAFGGDGEALNEKCEALARFTAEAGGATPLAWAVLARITGIKADYVAMNDALAKSFATGPNEHWLAENRFVTAERFLPHLTPDVRKAHEADTLLMLRSRHAIETVVRQYLIDQDFRTRIVAVVGTLSDAEQQSFVASVRQISNRIASPAR